MKIVHLSHSDISGGASRAAYRIHKMLLKFGIESSMWVDIKKSDDPNVFGPDTIIEELLRKNRQHLRFPINKLLKSKIYGMHSLSLLPSGWVKKINATNADIIHLHWIQGEMISLKEISDIKKPVVWSFHDMWPFTGTEHYAYNNRYIDGYSVNNLSKNEFKYFDINRWRWKQKLKFFRKPLQIISPSNWMTNCIKKSYLMKKWPVETIVHPIDISKWYPNNKKLSRKEFSFPENSKLLIFGAVGGSKDLRKGFKFLETSLKKLKNLNKEDNIEIIIFGGNKSDTYSDIKFKIHHFNNIKNDDILKKLYSASDLMIIPSKMETLGLTALESLACGTPVVAFRNTGLSDIIFHKKNGYLAEFLDEQDLANGINWVIKNSSRNNLCVNAREIAQDFFSEEVVIKKFKAVYNNLLLK